MRIKTLMAQGRSTKIISYTLHPNAKIPEDQSQTPQPCAYRPQCHHNDPKMCVKWRFSTGSQYLQLFKRHKVGPKPHTINLRPCARQAMVTSKAALEKGVWAASTLHMTNLTHLGFLLVQVNPPLP